MGLLTGLFDLHSVGAGRQSGHQAEDLLFTLVARFFGAAVLDVFHRVAFMHCFVWGLVFIHLCWACSFCWASPGAIDFLILIWIFPLFKTAETRFWGIRWTGGLWTPVGEGQRHTWEHPSSPHKVAGICVCT